MYSYNSPQPSQHRGPALWMTTAPPLGAGRAWSRDDSHTTPPCTPFPVRPQCNSQRSNHTAGSLSRENPILLLIPKEVSPGGNVSDGDWESLQTRTSPAPQLTAPLPWCHPSPTPAERGNTKRPQTCTQQAIYQHRSAVGDPSINR